MSRVALTSMIGASVMLSSRRSSCKSYQIQRELTSGLISFAFSIPRGMAYRRARPTQSRLRVSLLLQIDSACYLDEARPVSADQGRSFDERGQFTHCSVVAAQSE